MEGLGLALILSVERGQSGRKVDTARVTFCPALPKGSGTAQVHHPSSGTSIADTDDDKQGQQGQIWRFISD
jgi:hypothetical protein